MTGETISHYKIIEKLGQGGMGVVYKAQDTKLNRPVALKFLPQDLTRDQDAIARFINEAQAASALDHPNICVIHEIDEIPPSLDASLEEKAGQIFICMAYYDGETLQKKVAPAGAGLSVDSGIDIAIQIAQGLATAHQHGITHRDVKPANVMITKDGVAKIVDFGLAKLAGQRRITKSGMPGGTVAYMSPEQAQGLDADHRSDIWSLGVVLYEMLTGHLPFRGEYEAVQMYSIINEEPEPAQKYRPELSPEFLHVLNRALEKRPDERYQSVSDMLIDLRRLKRASERITRPPVGEMKTSEFRAMMPAPRLSNKKLWLSLGAIVIIVMVIRVFLLLPKRPPELNPNATFQVLPIPFTQINYPGLSPDGNWVAFPATDADGKTNVYFMNASGGEPRRIMADSNDVIWGVDISPDGSHIVYDRWNYGLKKSDMFIISSFGGMSKVLAGLGTLPLWRPDGQRIGYILGVPDVFIFSKSGRREFWSIRPDGTDNRLEFVDSVSATIGNFSFSWSPDGKSVAWIRTFSYGHADVIVHELETGKERQLTFDKKNINDVCWTHNNAIIFSSNKSGNTNLWMAPVSGGQTTQITKGIGPDTGIKISADGKKLMYVQQQPIGYVWLANINSSAARQITFDERNIWDPSFSPDGQRLLVCMAGYDPFTQPAQLYMMNRDDSNRQQMTMDVHQFIFDPIWSPDGKWIAYGSCSTSEPQDSARVYLIEASNPGNPRLLGKGCPWSWIDPKNLIVGTWPQSSRELSAAPQTWLFSIDGTAPKRLSQDSTFALPIFGEKHVLVQDLHKGREGWWIVPTKDWHVPPTGQPKKILGDYRYRWCMAPSRKFLFYLKKPGELWKISLPDGKQARLAGTFQHGNFSVSYDGQEIVYVEWRQQGKLVMIENLFK